MFGLNIPNGYSGLGLCALGPLRENKNSAIGGARKYGFTPRRKAAKVGKNKKRLTKMFGSAAFYLGINLSLL